MITGIQHLPPGQRPAGLIILSLLFVLPLFPPETRGEALAGCALLIGMLALLRWPAAAGLGQVLLVAGLALAAPAVLAASAPSAAVQPVAVLLLAGAAGIAAWGVGTQEGFQKSAATVVGLAAGVVAVHAVYQKLWGLEALGAAVRAQPALADHQALVIRLESGRAFASFATPAALGGFLALALPLTVGLTLGTRGRRRLVGWVAVAIQLAGFMVAASATAVAALFGAVLLSAVTWSRARRALAVGATVLLLLLAIVAVQRGERILDPSAPGSPWRLRAGNLRSAWTMATDHPWVGVGPGGFAESYPAYRRSGDNETRHAHNLPLELAAELGWTGAALFSLLFFYVMLRPLARNRTAGAPWRQGAAVGLAAFALQNLADFTVFMPSLLWTAALLAAVQTGRRRPAVAAAETGTAPVLAGISLAGVLVASALVALSGLSWNARVAGRDAAFAGDREEATRQAEKATGLAPWDVEAALLLARLTADVALDGPDETGLALALERADQVVRLSPVRPAARELRANLRLRSGDRQGALADLTEAARLYPLDTSYERSRELLRRRMETDLAGPSPRP